MHNAKPSVLRLFFILSLLELLKSVWFFRTSIPSVTPVRSLTRCAEPTRTGFIPREFMWASRPHSFLTRWQRWRCRNRSQGPRHCGERDEGRTKERVVLPHQHSLV